MTSIPRLLIALLCLLSIPAFANSAVKQDIAEITAPPLGFFKHQQGNMTVTALWDGVVFLPRNENTNISTKRRDALLKQAGVRDTPQGIETPVNAFLLEQNNEVILVDTGTADCFASFNPHLGKLGDNLNAAGYQPEQVRHVLLTHGHPDHLCGLVDSDGQAVFVNATVWISERELAYWQNDDEKAKVPENFRFVFDQVQTALAPYIAKGQLKAFGAGDTLPLHAKAIATPGHTIGHTSFLFEETGGHPLLVWGDLMHFAATQFAEPTSGYAIDTDPDTHQDSRESMLRQASTYDWTIAGAHLPFPAIGQVAKNETKGYRWIPTTNQ